MYCDISLLLYLCEVRSKEESNKSVIPASHENKKNEHVYYVHYLQNQNSLHSKSKVLSTRQIFHLIYPVWWTLSIMKYNNDIYFILSWSTARHNDHYTSVIIPWQASHLHQRQWAAGEPHFCSPPIPLMQRGDGCVVSEALGAPGLLCAKGAGEWRLFIYHPPESRSSPIQDTGYWERLMRSTIWKTTQLQQIYPVKTRTLNEKNLGYLNLINYERQGKLHHGFNGDRYEGKTQKRKKKWSCLPQA